MPGWKVCADISLHIFPFESEMILLFISILSPHPAIRFSIFHFLHTTTHLARNSFLSIPLLLSSPTKISDNSLAITDAAPRALPAVAQILICPLFFTAPETAKDLQSKTYKTNPGRRDPPSWCSPGQKFADFETAGHTLLHEMTHLDALGAAAGLSPRG